MDGRRPFGLVTEVMRRVVPLAATMLLACQSQGGAGDARPTDLTTDRAVDPLGIDSAIPRLAWKVPPIRRGAAQKAYQVVAWREMSGMQEPIWDTRRVESSVSTGIPFAGPHLESRTRYGWRVRIWDERDGATPWSAEGSFETGLLAPGDWSARWIAREVPVAADVDGRTSQLRREFTLPDGIRRARVYSSALGDYRLEINGKTVGDDFLAPGWTDYRKRVQYQVHDVTALVREGANALGAVLSTGWYAGKLGATGKDRYGSGQPGLLVQLEVIRDDGSRITVTSDHGWRTIQGPYLSADHQDGETYDARLETPGWSSPGFDDSAWAPVVMKADVPLGLALVARTDPPIRAIREFAPVSVRRISPDVQIVDIGQNITGVARLVVRGARPGTEVRLRFGEVLNEDGTLYTENLRTARATDRYVTRGAPEEEWMPRFTFHGFRFIEVTGYPGEFTSGAIQGVVLGADMAISGRFATSNSLLDRLQANITWAQRGNFLSIPTDCPQRDERLGWTGDINVFVPTAVFNMDVSRFLGMKWMADVRDAQEGSGAIPWIVPLLREFAGHDDMEWGSAAIHVPFVLWQTYGDTRVIDDNWDMMSRAMQNWERVAGATHLLGNESYGDWLAPEESSIELLNTAWLKRDADMMGRMAAATGREAAAADHAALSSAIRDAFVRRYVAPDGAIRGPMVAGGEPLLETQTQYVVAIAWDLLPSELREAAATRLVARIERAGWHLGTGFHGTPEILFALSDMGRVEEAYRLLMQDTSPSWLYEVKTGATTTWERWDSLLPDGSINRGAAGMNSFNHYALGAVGNWMYRNVAGLRTDTSAPGFKRSIIQPRPGGRLTSASASFESVYGEVRSSWRLEGTAFLLDVMVPPNTTAEIHVPATARSVVTEGDVPAEVSPGVTFVVFRAGASIYSVPSGTFHFRSDPWGGAAP